MYNPYFNILLVLAVLYVEESVAQMPYFRKVELPERAKFLVEGRIGKWDYFKSSIPVFDSTQRQVGWENADIITGDFNGDGESDYALLARGIDSALTDRGFFLVLFKMHQTYDVHLVDSVRYNSELVLLPNYKGQEVYDIELDKSFRLPVDGIMLYFFEKAGDTYYYQDGEFHSFLSAD